MINIKIFCSIILILFYIYVLFLYLHPNVTQSYREAYIEKSSIIYPQMRRLLDILPVRKQILVPNTHILFDEGWKTGSDQVVLFVTSARFLFKLDETGTRVNILKIAFNIIHDKDIYPQCNLYINENILGRLDTFSSVNTFYIDDYLVIDINELRISCDIPNAIALKSIELS
ncbi:MAG: hypothetical protein LBT43_06430 [Prevotella sp.]|jgi:hypothetical protein|nr:hypothetical protein [Prevotella sp.]